MGPTLCAYGDIPSLWEYVARMWRMFLDVSDLSVTLGHLAFRRRLFADEFRAERSSFFAEENGVKRHVVCC